MVAAKGVFPNVWTSEGWAINSTTWNHLKLMWLGPFLDLLRQVYKETQRKDRIEACGYDSETWRILKSINQVKVMVGESAITSAPFLKKWGKEIHFFLGGTTARHQGKLGNTVGKPKCRVKGGKSKSATQGERLVYLVEGQSKGRRGTDIPRAQSMHL